MNLITKLEILPEGLKKNIYKTWILLSKIIFYGHSRYCPICNSHIRKFYSPPNSKRKNAMCPVCRSLERHRFLWVFLKTKTNLFDNSYKNFLHVAPERIFMIKFNKLKHLNYVTGDLFRGRSKIKLDACFLPFFDETFNILICNHVLEHIPDDRKAIKEFYRVMKKDSWAIITVPITEKTTFEDPSIKSPIERKKLFGQEDHVRKYGLDFKDRLKSAGFEVFIFKSKDFIAPDLSIKMGISDNDRIYYCIK